MSEPTFEKAVLGNPSDLAAVTLDALADRSPAPPGCKWLVYSSPPPDEQVLAELVSASGRRTIGRLPPPHDPLWLDRVHDIRRAAGPRGEGGLGKVGIAALAYAGLPPDQTFVVNMNACHVARDPAGLLAARIAAALRNDPNLQAAGLERTADALAGALLVTSQIQLYEDRDSWRPGRDFIGQRPVGRVMQPMQRLRMDLEFLLPDADSPARRAALIGTARREIRAGELVGPADVAFERTAGDEPAPLWPPGQQRWMDENVGPSEGQGPGQGPARSGRPPRRRRGAE